MSVDTLPAPRAIADVEPPRAPSSLRGSGRVLVVDDDDAVRMIVSHSVERMGFRALQFSNGTEALDLLQQDDQCVLLAVVDLRLPGMDGVEVMRRLRARRPSLPVILTSGYFQRDPDSPLSTEGPTRFLHKPFTLSALTAEIRAVLGA